MDELDTHPVDETLGVLRRARIQVAAMRRALEQSMDAPGGLEWESQVSAPPELESEQETPGREKSPAERERERRWREEFSRNWPEKPPRK